LRLAKSELTVFDDIWNVRKLTALSQVIDFADPRSIVELPSGRVRRSPMLTFDPEWLAISRAFHPYLSTSRSQPPFPNQSQATEMVRKEMDWVMQHVGVDGVATVTDCQTFIPTAPGPGQEGSTKFQQRE
jgi:lariat debranching enzyme